MNHLWIVALAAGCAAKPPALVDPIGATPIIVTNNGQHSICTFLVELTHHKNEPGYKMIFPLAAADSTQHDLPHGESIQFGVKPETYDLTLVSCDTKWKAHVEGLVISRPTAFGIDQPSVNAPADYARAELRLAPAPTN